MCLSHSNEHAKAADGIVADEPGWSELVILLSSRWTAKVKVNHWEQDQVTNLDRSGYVPRCAWVETGSQPAGNLCDGLQQSLGAEARKLVQTRPNCKVNPPFQPSIIYFVINPLRESRMGQFVSQM